MGKVVFGAYLLQCKLFISEETFDWRVLARGNTQLFSLVNCT
ncbi:hypothetical protein BRADI_3g52522v3 [Brachypodium distachyon]|uniref:Uncharacterized protein n=1 Tax=Brachypodium distachyon TaxID=15368 RepID=A0A0Q3JQS0_BRADI|nr:hypothetical protein BRADI_3g52522v3 [Brachypodium distachyon]